MNRITATRLERLEETAVESDKRTPLKQGELEVWLTARLCLTPEEYARMTSLTPYEIASDDAKLDEAWELLQLGMTRLSKYFDDMEAPPTLAEQIVWRDRWEDRNCEWLPPERYMDLPQPWHWTPVQRKLAIDGYRAEIAVAQARHAAKAGAQ